MKPTWSRRRFVRTALQGAVAVRAADLAASASPFSASQRAILRAAMDEIIPAGDGMPSASQAGGLTYLQDVAGREGAFRDALVKALAALQLLARRGGLNFVQLSTHYRAATLRGLEESNPADFRALREAVYEAYYTRPDIWRRIGYEFYPPERPGPVPAPFDEKALQRVRTMPRLYREVG